MTWLPLMNDVDRQDASNLVRWRCGAAVGALLLLPGIAQAQSYSPGDLVVTPPPSLNDGRAGSTIFGSTSKVQTRNAAGPATANPPDFQYTAFADLSGRYTTNALGSPGNSADFDTRAALTFNAMEQSNRVNAALNYTGAVDYFVENSGGVIFTNNLTGSALVDVFPDHFTLSANVFAMPQYASQLGNIAPSGETLPAGANGDVRNSYGFSVSPDFYFRLGDFLRSDSQPSYSEVFYDSPVGAGTGPLGSKVASNLGTGAFTQRITSGDDFTRLQWAAVANYTQMSHSAGGLTQRSATGELSYALTHGISLVADGGYQTVKADVALSKVLSGPIFFGGLKFDTPRITGDFRIGEQYRALSVTGHLTYQMSPVLTLSAAAIDDVSTPGAGIFNPASLLSGIGGGISSGQLQLPSSGIPNLSDTNLSGIGLQGTPSRIQTQSVSLQYSLDRLMAQITASATNQQNVTGFGTLPGQNNSLRSMAISPSVTYTFSEDWSATAYFAYTDQKLAIGRSTLAEFNARSNYTISDKTQIYIEGDYLQRDSNAALAALSSSSGSVSITSVRVGLRRQL